MFRIGVGMTDPTIPTLLHGFFGGTLYKVKGAKINWKSKTVWEINARKALAFIEVVYPYLLIKKPQADVGMRFQRAGYSKLNDVDRLLGSIDASEIHDLNKRGV